MNGPGCIDPRRKQPWPRLPRRLQSAEALWTGHPRRRIRPEPLWPFPGRPKKAQRIAFEVGRNIVRVGVNAHQNKQTADGQLGHPVVERPLENQALHSPASTLYLLHDTVQYKSDFFVLEGFLLNNSRGPKAVAPVDDINAGGELGKVDGFLDGCVAASHHSHFLVAIKGGVADGAIGNTLPRKFGFPFHIQLVGGSARCEDDGPRLHRSVGQHHSLGGVSEIKTRDLGIPRQQAETEGLGPEELTETEGTDAFGKPGVVLHPLIGQELPPIPFSRAKPR